MLQRWCSKLRPLAAARRSMPETYLLLLRRHSSISSHFLHIRPHFTHNTQTISRSFFSPNFDSPLGAPFPPISYSPLQLTQVRHITAKQKERKLKSRKPMTPITSKVKKIKMKYYSSYKGRFRVMSNGQIRRWKEGKRHNAHSKSKKSKRRLRQPSVVPLAYAKVMKKLNFCN
ncbi:uncharacterized protein LOC127250112 [Andrographis paniculata]|uniref:uncharacterized protein LOC127250112 n=1 Tax=Andrographis paniculata TaxID=175694 RepID=UPI0021E79D05|nr:uncharacterized protein LOC127250112 [Andrographis paniculata]